MGATDQQRAAFGRLLRRLRRERSLTQEALAQQIAYAVDTIKKVEQGLRSPSHQLVACLADGLGLDGAEREQLFSAARSASRAQAPSHMHEERGADERRSQLPATPTPLVGRTEDVAELTQLMCSSEHRLVTILGPGGMGKTRLAVEAARAAQAAFPDGVSFVELVALRAPESIAQRLAEAVQLPIQSDGRPIVQQLLAYLRPKRLLLVLDNLEQALPEAASLVSELLCACPSLCLLVTSRERLLLSNEIVYTLKHLPFPTWETPLDALHYDAVRLFIETARRVQPDLADTPETLRFVARICRLVEGMPLGIILAATQADVLSISDIAAELLHSYDFLHVALRDLPDRQRSMRAVITSSWQRLDGDTQVGFAKLSSFRGAFTRAAAQSIAGVPLRMLTRLVHASFVQRSGDRFVLHELLRHYGEEQLQQLEAAAAVHGAHSRYFLTFVAERAPDLAGAAQLTTLAALRAELENIRAAWHWAVEQQQYAAIDGALHGVFRWFWLDRGQQEQGFSMLHAALERWAHADDPVAIRVRARMAARLLPVDGPWLSDGAAALERIRGALELARAQGDEAEIAFCLWGMGLALVSAQRHAKERNTLRSAVACYQQSLAYYLAHGEIGWAAQVREHLGHCYRMMQHYEDAAAIMRESLAAREALGDQFGRARCARELGFVAYLMGSAAEAAGAWSTALAISRTLGDAYGEMDSLFFLTVLALTGGAWADARPMLDHVIAMADHAQSALYQGWCARTRQIIAAMEEADRALSAPARALPQQHTRFAAQLFFLLYGRELHSELARLLSIAHSEDEHAALLPFAARLFAQAGDAQAAERLLRLADRYPTVAGSWLMQLPEISSMRTAPANSLGFEDLQRFWEGGQALALDTAIGMLRATLERTPWESPPPHLSGAPLS